MLRHLWVCTACVTASVLSVTPALAAEDLQGPSQVHYAPPVDGPIIDHFRAPAARWAAGNRGIDYEAIPGEAVLASADGTVEFAGQVGGTLHVVVKHADGLRTSYSFLASVSVIEGQQLARGTPVGRAGASVHFGVRLGDTYLDPELVLEGRAFGVRLVPVEDQTEAERRLGEMVRDAFVDEWAAGGGDGVPAAVVGWLRDTADPAELLRLAIHYTKAVSVPVHIASAGFAVARWYRQRTTCTASDGVTAIAEQPVGDHIVVLVAGFGSSSESGAGIDGVDFETIGIPVDRVMRFSYNGGRVPGSSSGASGPFAGLDTTTYTTFDSQRPLDEAAERLRQTLEQVAAENPGAPIDVIGHSQGGVVALRALQLGAAAGSPPVGVRLVTIASPHRGDTLATGADLLSRSPLHELALDGAEIASPQFAHDVHDDGSAHDLSAASAFMDDYQSRGLPPGVFAVSIGGRWDPVVPTRDARLDGAAHITVDVGGVAAHGRLPSADVVTTQVALAVRGARPTCEGLLDALTDHLASDAVATAEDLVALGLG